MQELSRGFAFTAARCWWVVSANRNSWNRATIDYQSSHFLSFFDCFKPEFRNPAPAVKYSSIWIAHYSSNLGRRYNGLNHQLSRRTLARSTNLLTCATIWWIQVLYVILDSKNYFSKRFEIKLRKMQMTHNAQSTQTFMILDIWNMNAKVLPTRSKACCADLHSTRLPDEKLR